MSLYNYPNWHEIKDLVNIYREGIWDNAEVVVWDPIKRRKVNLVFVGSTRPGLNTKGLINFVIFPKKMTFWDRFLFKTTTKLIYIKCKIRKLIRK